MRQSPIPSIIAVVAFAILTTWVLNAVEAGASVVMLGILAISAVAGLVASSIASR